MSAGPEIAERLADQLDLPAGARDAGEDAELAALLALAEQVDVEWTSIAPPPGAAERVFEAAARNAERRPRRLPVPRLPALPGLRRVPWPARAAAAATALAGTILVIVSLAGNPPGTSQILAQAEAAISVTDRIIHQVFDSSATVEQAGKRTATRLRMESWSYFAGGVHTRVISEDKQGRPQLEVTVTPRESQSFFPATNTLYVQALPQGATNLPPAAGGGPPATVQDAVALLRQAFDEKRVKLAGETEVDGTPAYEMHVDLSGHMGMTKGKLIYIVDRRDYLPLETRTESETEAGGVVTRVVSQQRYRKFELLEPTAANRALPRPPRHPGAKIERLPTPRQTPSGTAEPSQR